jgi:hypothetical protein
MENLLGIQAPGFPFFAQVEFKLNGTKGIKKKLIVLNSKPEEPILLMKIPFKPLNSNLLNIAFIFKVDFTLTALFAQMCKGIE